MEKEEVQAEKVDTRENKEEKKPGFFSRIKKNFDDSILESNIKSAYEKDHRNFDVYSENDGLFGGDRCCGDIKDGYLEYFGDDKIEEGDVVIDSGDSKAYYAVGECERTKVSAMVDGTIYERDGYKIALDPEVKEVKVIKAGKRYFLPREK